MNYTENLVPINDTDRAYLKKQAKLVLLIVSAVAIVFFGIATGFCIYNGDWYVLFFAGFFSLIFVFIGLFAYRRASIYTGPNARKWVIEGEILEKKENTTLQERAGRQDMDTEYFLVFENRVIKVNYNHYKTYSAGDIVHIESTENGEVTLNVSPIEIKERDEGNSIENDWLSDYSEYMLDDERKVIRKSLIKRSIISLVILVIVYFIATIVSAIVIAYNFDMASQPIRHLMVFGRYYVVILLGVALYTLMIRKRLSDLLSNQKRIMVCKVSDKIESNVKLLGRNVRTSVRGDYHYIFVGKKLYNIPAEDFHSIEIGSKVKIHVGNKSGYFLGVDLLNKKR